MSEEDHEIIGKRRCWTYLPQIRKADRGIEFTEGRFKGADVGVGHRTGLVGGGDRAVKF
jgi:hypothetical protein